MKIYQILWVAFSIIYFPSHASESVPEEALYKVKTLQDFKEYFEKELAYYPKSTLLLIHVEGIVTDTAIPSPAPDVDERAAPCEEMVTYLKSLTEVSIVYTSYLYPPNQIFHRLNDIGLLEQVSSAEEGQLEISYASSQSQVLAFSKNQDCALVKRINTNFPDKKIDYNFYYQKAFAPVVIYGLKKRWDQIVYLDHSELSYEHFKEDIKETPYYPSLKRILTIKISPKF
ncbi:MAG: hypothetical protein BGO76_06945 [Caedibacter sp. 38-128]|nr:hypothetical protein [Holosporales bacterium]OJX04750.1 MAG: hypothetical protein BGO76_06945 [Caedibacter sp. 38-128]